MSGPEQDAQPLYSQALLQAHPASPAPPRAAARGGTRQSALPTSRGKENSPPSGGTSAAASVAERPARWDDGEMSAASGTHQGDGAVARPPPGRQGAGPGSGARTYGARTIPLAAGGASSTAHPVAARPVARDGRQAFVDRRSSAANIAVANRGAASNGSGGGSDSGNRGVLGRGVVSATGVSGGGGGGAIAAAGRGQGGVSGVANSQGGGQGGGASLTKQQRQKMLENRAKALARLKAGRSRQCQGGGRGGSRGG